MRAPFSSLLQTRRKSMQVLAERAPPVGGGGGGGGARPYDYLWRNILQGQGDKNVGKVDDERKSFPQLPTFIFPRAN